MEDLQRLYPIGIQTFFKIREGNFLYIDKTEYVYRMTHSASSYLFLSRPRRFGKSLLTSTLHCYFEGRKELFEGLAMETLEKEWIQHPVLHFDMSTAKHVDKEQLNAELELKLMAYEEIYGRVEEELYVNQRLEGLIKRAYKQTGKKVVVLIDEYDAPLLDVVHEEKNLPQLRNVMRNFYSPLKACDPYLRFVFLTGITKFSQLSVFSELNNITNVSMLPDYAAICGITAEELRTQMAPDVKHLATRLGITAEEMLDRLKENYDGYHFSWPSPDVFNPFSLLKAMALGEIGSYWFESGTPTYIIEMLRKYAVLPSEIGGEEASPSDFNVPLELATNYMPLLYQAGYLTIKGADLEFDAYMLDINSTSGHFSEFETYGTYCLVYYPEFYGTQFLNTFRSAALIRGRYINDFIIERLAMDVDIASFEIYDAIFPYDFEKRKYLLARKIRRLCSSSFKDNVKLICENISRKMRK